MHTPWYCVMLRKWRELGWQTTVLCQAARCRVGRARVLGSSIRQPTFLAPAWRCLPAPSLLTNTPVPSMTRSMSCAHPGHQLPCGPNVRKQLWGCTSFHDPANGKLCEGWRGGASGAHHLAPGELEGVPVADNLDRLAVHGDGAVVNHPAGMMRNCKVHDHVHAITVSW